MESGTSSSNPAPSAYVEVLYSDTLVEITNEGILFRKYYLFTSTPRFVPFSEIDRIDVLRPSITTGKWRIGGSSSPGRIWFPLDWHRPSRDRIFRLLLRNGKSIGFTVEDSAFALFMLRGLGVIGSDETS